MKPGMMKPGLVYHVEKPIVYYEKEKEFECSICHKKIYE